MKIDISNEAARIGVTPGKLTADEIEASLARVGLDTSTARLANPEPAIAAVGPFQATRAVIVDNDIMRLALAVGDEVVASLPLGPADAVAIASDLLLCARRRMGRAVAGT